MRVTNTGAVPGRKRVLAWIDVSNGYQHDSVSHAVATMERLGYETGTYDTFIRSDSQLITKGILGHDGQPLLYAKNLNDFDAIFFFGVREIDFRPRNARTCSRSCMTTARVWWWRTRGPRRCLLVGVRRNAGRPLRRAPVGIVAAPVLVEDPKFPGMEHLPHSFGHVDEYYQIKGFDRSRADVILRLDVSHLELAHNPLVHHQDGNFPLVWAKTYGKGRVYYSALGHDPSTWDDRAVQTMYFEAMRWALHLTDANATPHPLVP